MSEPTPEHDAPEPVTPTRLLSSRAECVGVLRDALQRADAAGCRDLAWCDVDYAEWPLGEPSFIDSLSRWARPHRRLTVHALSFERLAALHPRWVVWRQRFAHVVTCRALQDLEPAQVPSLLVAPGLGCLRCPPTGLRRGAWSEDPAEIERTRLVLDALAQRCADAFPATTLGL
jgi:hypothetical protein